ncbi:OmpA family protein [Flavobacterium sp. HSC-61S13]|uniref:OmpA family protein n=1 Tax=Flavobacterium sp. HSC-61S13 TaxID=2910963 RepID=UPI00209C9945|nr:OmpA family protein [Flavobacterium sp. HSC-61S13]MCP1997469.1 outer membrane protein OmpA-like peptidoglycan-associated protein/tetratricopeptide (TPR) repeat protein [Flavobacterium sp. HSC-61S13]
MIKKLYKIGVFGFLLISLGVQAQVNQEKLGDKNVDNYAYIEAIKIYERIASKGYESPNLSRNLADSYYFNGKLVEANKWYAKMFEQLGDKPMTSEYYYRYAQTLKAVGMYADSDAYLEKFRIQEIADTRGVIFSEHKDYLAEIKANSGRYNIKNIDMNSSYSDYGSTVYKDQLIFTTARDTGSISKKIHSWTGASFTNLYAASIESDGSVGETKPFAKEVRSKFNESTPVFSADGNTMYFTRNNFLNGKRGKDSKQTTLLKIYKATLKDGKWSDVQALPFNSDQFSTAHPALTADGNWMYFASDREGGVGQSDLYKVAILTGGSFGEPINLGDLINTEGRETFPFITPDNELYFSTDGRPGLGGMDIYVAEIRADGSFSEVQNLGAPANSPLDDFAYYINFETRKGFLSSNRDHGIGNDDIYSFLETRRLNLKCLQNVHGMVYDKRSNEPLPGANLILMDGDFTALAETVSDANGLYRFDALNCGDRIRINASLDGFNTAEIAVKLPMENGETLVDFGLEKNRIEVKKGDDLFKVLKMEPIFFDFDKSNIRPDAALELAKIVEVLLQYPEMKIDVRSHTDSRGKDAYNMSLSDRRAKSTVQWIIDQGIAKKRVTGRGYGESQLINRCKNGVKCSEEEHQENRRSEFIVLDL